MGKRIIERAKKIVAVFMSLVLVVGLTPMPAFAFSGEDGQGDSAALAAGSGAGLEAAEVQAGGGVGTPAGTEIVVAKNLIEGAIFATGSGPVSWGAGQLMTVIFGDAFEEDTAEKLDEILQKLDEIEKSINALSDKVSIIQMQTILNDLTDVLGVNTPYVVYNTLRDIDADLADKEISVDQAKEERLNALTTALGITDYGTVNSEWDQYVDKLWSTMTSQYNVMIGDKSQKLTLMQVDYELLRHTHKWENQAYDDWGDFKGRCVSLLISTLLLERASLEARIERLGDDDNKKRAVSERLDLVNDMIEQAVGKNVILSGGVQVVYPGLFSEDTWAAQYWMYKERPDYRYYWVPGHEILFYSQVSSQDFPRETEGRGVRQPEYLKGISVKWSNSAKTPFDRYWVSVNHDYWKPFLRYQGGNIPLASVDQLKMIYKDYGSSTHLYNIFIDKDEGNFLGLDEKGVSHWWFLINEDEDHKLTYDHNTIGADELYCNVVTSAHVSVETAILCKYHLNTDVVDKYRHYIGVGVARSGPETYDPDNVQVLPDAVAETHTATNYDVPLWWPTCDDLPLAYDSDAHGAIVTATLDGKELAASDYTVEGDDVVLPQALVAGLPYGEHTLELTTEKGSHTVSFATAEGPATTATMGRLYNPNSGEHFYTSDAAEFTGLVEAGWLDEGVGWYAPDPEGADPVYRLYNDYGGEHHYTLDAAERESLVAAGWVDEGVGWYSDSGEAVPIYREYNPNEPSCNHNYTADADEHANLVSLGWVDEGIAWYALEAEPQPELPDPELPDPDM